VAAPLGPAAVHHWVDDRGASAHRSRRGSPALLRCATCWNALTRDRRDVGIPALRMGQAIGGCRLFTRSGLAIARGASSVGIESFSVALRRPPASYHVNRTRHAVARCIERPAKRENQPFSSIAVRAQPAGQLRAKNRRPDNPSAVEWRGAGQRCNDCGECPRPLPSTRTMTSEIGVAYSFGNRIGIIETFIRNTEARHVKKIDAATQTPA
jgi:hypothetical protein